MCKSVPDEHTGQNQVQPRDILNRKVRNMQDKEIRKTRGIDSHTEYGSLRQELLDTITSRDNFIIAMYTITAAVLCVAFELHNPILFLIPYVVLFAFQNSIASKSENMIVLATYIAVYLEDDSNWESNYDNLKKAMHVGIPYKRHRSIWGRLVGRIGSVQLGLLCSISCAVYAGLEAAKLECIMDMIEPFVYILVAVILYVLIRIKTKDVYELGKRRSAYIENLRKNGVIPEPQNVM